MTGTFLYVDITCTQHDFKLLVYIMIPLNLLNTDGRHSVCLKSLEGRSMFKGL